MAEVKIGIAKTPKQAEKLGRTITESVTLTEKEERKIRDDYAAEGKKEEIAFGAVVTIITGATGFGVKNIKKALEVTLSAATGAFTSAVFKSYSSQLASKFDMITNDNPTKCTMVYQYKRVGSNDGFYWLKDIKIK